MNTKQFSGVYTALVTPLLEESVDYASLEKLVEFQIGNGISGLVSVGTTGESPTLSPAEHLDVVRKTVEFAAGRVPVFAGTGSNNTAEAVTYTREADAAGATGMLQVAPYYNKPSQEGLFFHFSAVAEVTEKPIMLYSIPGRCGIDISVSVCRRLRDKYPHVSIMKEAGGSCDRVGQLRKELGDDYTVLSGDDSLTLPFMAAGADGVVSVASNYFPAEVSRMVRAALDNDFIAAQADHLRFFSFFKDIFIEPNPVPIKRVMAAAGLIASDAVRLPLAPLSLVNADHIEALVARLPRPQGL